MISLDFLLKISTLFSKIPSENWFWSNVSLEWKSANYPTSVLNTLGVVPRSQSLAPVRFTNPNSNHRVVQIAHFLLQHWFPKFRLLVIFIEIINLFLAIQIRLSPLFNRNRFVFPRENNRVVKGGKCFGVPLQGKPSNAFL